MADTKIDFEVKATIGDAQKAFDLIEQKIAAVGETVEGLTKKSGDLKIALGQSKIGSEAFSFLSKAVAKTETDLMNAAIATKKYANEVQNMSEINRRGAMVGLSFNRIIQDAGYFGQSMAMGFMAVGNNITYFAEQLSFAKQQGLSMTGVLKGMLTGVNAWMFAINLAVSAITFFTVQTRGATDANDDFGKSLDKTTAALLKMKEFGSSFMVNPEDVGTRLNQLDALRQRFAAEAERISLGAGARIGKGGAFAEYFVNLFASKELTEAEKNRLKAIDAITKKLTEQKSELEAQLEISNILRDLGVQETKDAGTKDKVLKSIKDTVAKGDFGLLDALENIFSTEQTKRVKEQADYIWKMAEAFGKMPKFGEGDNKGMIIPNQIIPNVPMPRNGLWEDLTEFEAKKDKKMADEYRKVLGEFSRLGSNLRTIFKDAGDSFLNSMIEALNVVTAIAEVVQSIHAIMTALDLISTVSTGGVIVAPAKIANWVLGGGGSSGSIQSGGNGMSQSPSQMIIPIYIGEKKIETIIIDTTKQAQRLRYL